MLNNGLAIVLTSWVTTSSGRAIATWIYRNPGQGLYHWWFVALGAGAAAVLLHLLNRDLALKVPTSGGRVGEPLEAMGSAS
jgi:sodium transport system permease protein